MSDERLNESDAELIKAGLFVMFLPFSAAYLIGRWVIDRAKEITRG